MEKKIHTHYDNLKVARNAPIEVIRAAYKTLCQKYHPDKNPDSPRASKYIQLINASYEVLSDVKKRGEHDAWIDSQEKLAQGHSASGQSTKSQGTDESDVYSLPSSGQVGYWALPETIRKRLRERVSGLEMEQMSIDQNKQEVRYVGGTLFALWFVLIGYLAFFEKWPQDANQLVMWVSLFVAVGLSYCIAWIWVWKTSPLKNWFLVTPIYLIQTNLQLVRYWPIWSLSDIKATHKHNNGYYKNTELTLTLDASVEEFVFQNKSTYAAFVEKVRVYQGRVRKALDSEDMEYFSRNDDFVDVIDFSSDPRGKHTKAIVFTLSMIICSLVWLCFYFVNASVEISNDRALDFSPVSTQRHVSLAADDLPKTNYPDALAIIRARKANEAAQSNEPNAADTFDRIQARRGTASTSRYKRPDSSENGEAWPAKSGYVRGYEILYADGLSKLTIDNARNNSDVFVKLVSLDSAKQLRVRHFFVKAHDSFTINKVRAGKYDIRYRDMDSGATSKSDPFEIEELSTEDGIQFSTIAITLYKISGGNMEMVSISESDF